MTIYTPELVQRNAMLAASGAFKGLPFPTNPALRVIGCVDSRVDPSDVLGLELGDAVVMRNIGGRVTPEALRSWALLGHLGAGHSPSGGHLAILHHTDCGIRRLASYPEHLAAFFEIPVADLGSKAVDDPYASVRIDVDIAVVLVGVSFCERPQRPIKAVSLAQVGRNGDAVAGAGLGTGQCPTTHHAGHRHPGPAEDRCSDAGGAWN
jgi:carbonic anhydrase